MEKQEYKSKWDDLVREIGAEISPEIIEREEAASSRSESDLAAAKSMEGEAAAHAVPPKRAATDWNSLVTGLGLPPLPPEPEPEPEAKPAPPQRVVAREEPRRERPTEREERQPRRERPQRQDSRRERGRGRGRGEDTGSRREEREPREAEAESHSRREERRPREVDEESRERSERGGRGRRGRGGQRRSPRERDGREERIEREEGREERPDAEVEQTAVREEQRAWNDTRETRESRVEEEPARAEERAVEPPQRPEPVRDEPLKSAAISLWHKIFGTPAEQEAKLTEERVEEHEAIAPLDFREEPTDASGYVDVRVDEKPADDFAVEAERGEEADSVAGDETGERPRGRSRRRRGRGRGRRSESAESGDAAEEPARDRGRGSEAGGRRRRRRDDDVEDEESLDDHMSEDDAGEEDDEELVSVGESRRSALQRAIPSWDEAISFIVDANMQNRSQRKPSRSGPRENGGGGSGGRGRSRGRRKPQ